MRASSINQAQKQMRAYQESVRDKYHSKTRTEKLGRRSSAKSIPLRSHDNLYVEDCSHSRLNCAASAGSNLTSKTTLLKKNDFVKQHNFLSQASLHAADSSYRATFVSNRPQDSALKPKQESLCSDFSLNLPEENVHDVCFEHADLTHSRTSFYQIDNLFGQPKPITFQTQDNTRS